MDYDQVMALILPIMHSRFAKSKIKTKQNKNPPSFEMWTHQELRKRSGLLCSPNVLVHSKSSVKVPDQISPNSSN